MTHLMILQDGKRTKEWVVSRHFLSTWKQTCIYGDSRSPERTTFSYLPNYVRFLWFFQLRKQCLFPLLRAGISIWLCNSELPRVESVGAPSSQPGRSHSCCAVLGDTTPCKDISCLEMAQGARHRTFSACSACSRSTDWAHVGSSTAGEEEEE